MTDARHQEVVDAIIAMALEIRGRRYNIKTKLDRDDRRVFDRLGVLVDEFLYGGAK